MTPKTLTLAALALTAATGTAHAAPSASPTGVVSADRAERVLATYQPTTDRFCVRSRDYDPVAETGTRIYRPCMTQREWADRGVRFERPAATTQVAAR